MADGRGESVISVFIWPLIAQASFPFSPHPPTRCPSSSSPPSSTCTTSLVLVSLRLQISSRPPRPHSPSISRRPRSTPPSRQSSPTRRQHRNPTAIARASSSPNRASPSLRLPQARPHRAPHPAPAQTAASPPLRSGAGMRKARRSATLVVRLSSRLGHLFISLRRIFL